MVATAVRTDGSRATGLDLLWTGGDPLVATISAGGLVSAVGPGSATVTVTGGGRSATAIVTVVPVPVAAVSVTPPIATVAAGGKVTLVGVALDGRGQTLGGRSLDWTSSDPAIASVSDRGEVTGLSAGQVTISAAAGGKSGSAAVTVTEPVAQRIGLAPAFANLLVGQQQPLSIIVIDEYGNQLGVEGIQWVSSAPTVATVAEGLVTAVAPGSATITASVDGATAKANITVAAVEVVSVSVSPSYLTLAEGESATVAAVGLDARGQPVPGHSVTWHSLAPSFATVSPAGVVTALAPGSAAVVASINGRNGPVTVNAIQAAVNEIALTPGSATIEAGATLALRAQARSSAGKNLDRPITWSSNAPSVATVSSAGVVTGIQAGVVKITAAAGGKSSATTITVTAARVATITLAPTTVSLVTGQTADFVATPRDAAGQALTGFSATWQTSAPAVATVSASGRVTAVGSGTATITVAIDGKTAQGSVVVDPAPVMSVAVVPGSATLTIGASANLVAEARDGAGGLLTGRPVTWRSSRPTVATVSTAGVVTAVTPGSATITATVEGREGSAAATVTDPPVASVAVTPDEASLTVGTSVPLSAEARDAAGNLLSGRTAVWTSGTPSVATVSATGVVSAVATGTTVISAVIDGKTGSATVTVTAVPVASVSVSPLTADLVVGGTRAFSAVARDAAGGTLGGRVPAWTSTAPGVATVASNGMVTAVAPGSAVIRATIEGKSATGMVTVTAVPVASVSVSPTAASLTVGSTRTLAATVRDGAGGELAGRAIAWSSSHPAIATVSSSGIVTAVAAGTATVSATSEGKVGTSAITVTNVPVASVAISPTSLSLAAGQTQTLSATARDVGGAVVTGRSAAWVSDAPSVAAVTPAGRVTAVAAGTARVTVTIEGKAATATVTVSPIAVASVVVVPSSVSLRVGQTQTIDATARDAADRELAGRVATWSSSAPSVATVGTDGTITAVAAGSAMVTATIEGKSAQVAVTVAPVPVATVAVSPAAPALVVGGSQALTAVAKDSAGAALTGRPVTWTSGTPSVATVSASGVVTAIAAGSATITAAVEGKSGTAAVTVSAVPVATVAVSPATASLSVGQTQPLSAIAKDVGGATLTGRPVTWTSSNSAAATVSSAGVVTAVAAGSATITATVEGKTGTAALTVVPPPVATVAVTPLVATVAVGGTASFTATPKDAGGAVLAGRPVTWTSDAQTIATVSTSGLVTGVGEGTALITATIEGKTASATVTVSPLPVATVAVTPTTASVVVGGTTPLTAQPRDAGGSPLTGRPVTWSTASAAVATVSTSGLVTAVAPGTTVITATSEGKSGTATITVTAVPVATVAVSPATASVSVGQTQSLSAIAKDAGGATLTGRPVTWTSSNSAAATVSSAGVVTAVAVGSATITATVEGKSGTAALTVVPVPVATVAVTPLVATVAVGETASFTATPKDAGGAVLAGRPITWTSDALTIATVSSSGVVTGVGEGTALVTATIEGKTASATVTVSPLPVATVAVTPATASVQVGGTTALTAQPRDAGGSPLTGRPVTWSSASAAVATVSTSGVVTAVAPGTSVITATSEGKTGTATITVTAVPVATVAVSPPTAALTVGQTQSVSAIARDSAGGTLTGRPVIWSSGTPAIATVSSGGLVTAVAPGTATITATVEGKTGTAAVTVTAVPVATVSVTPASSSVDVGQTLGLTATLRDAGGNVLTGRTISWTSSQPTIATVSALGVVTAIAAGSATITATADGKSGTGAVAVSEVSSGGPPVFPLRVEAGKRYLVDAAGKPFFVSGDSPWLLMVQLTREQIDQYLEDRRLKGINTILVELIESYFATNAPKNVYGQGPFLTPGDFATPNEAYFAHAEYAIAKAAEKGILVLLTPAYMGYNGAEEGWYSAMVANGTTKLRNYGRYLATRFRSHNNIMWVQGGDYNPPNLALLRAIPEGIREIETKWLHTFHGNRGTTPFAFLGTSEPWLGVNNIYTTSSVVPLSNTEYGRSTVPYFMIESYYEGSAAGFTGVSEALIRRQAYHAVLSGASGHLVGHHAIWTFSSGWQTQLNSQGAQAAMRLRNLFDSRSWWLLEPDRSRVLLTAGHGSNPTEAVASRATDRSFAFLFTPSIRDLTINMGQMAGPRVQARWYDPTNGTYHAVTGSPFPASGSVVLRPTGNNARGAGDWVLVLDAIP